MEIFREFLESSTIHGLSYISTSKVKKMPNIDALDAIGDAMTTILTTIFKESNFNAKIGENIHTLLWSLPKNGVIWFVRFGGVPISSSTCVLQPCFREFVSM